MTVPRYPSHFDNVAGSVTYSFGLNSMAVQETQSVRTPMAVGIGGDYQHDFLGWGVSPREPAKLLLSWIVVKSTAALVDTEVDSLKSKLLIGKGKLYTLGADGTSRWCYARISSMPTTSRGVGQFTHQNVSCEFVRLSNWNDATATTGSQAVTTTSQAFTVTNPGNVPVRDAVFTLTPLSSAGVNGPIMTNATNAMAWTSTRNLDATTKRLRNDNARTIIEYSTNSGSTYADDYAIVTRGATQIGMMTLDPGGNSITMTRASGTPNYTFAWAFNGQWA